MKLKSLLNRCVTGVIVLCLVMLAIAPPAHAFDDFAVEMLLEDKICGFECDLRGADLHGVDLSEADLYQANLAGANLAGANLRGAHLYKANLMGANLTGADLTDAMLYEAVLYSANLTDAKVGTRELIGAKLSHTTLPNGEVSDYPYF